jgi:foldase protein PrsA
VTYRSAFVVAVLPLALLATACGSSHQAATTTTSAAARSRGPTVPLEQSDVAVVGGEHVTKTEVLGMVDELIAAARQAHQPVPKQGTAAYKTLRDEAVNYFVSSFALEQRARQDLGIAVSPKAVDRSIDAIRRKNFGGSETKMLQHFASAGITPAQLRIFQRIQLAENELPQKLAARHHVKVSTAQARAYYKTHLRAYTNIAPTRAMRDLKVGSRKLAQSLYAQLQKGASFEALAAKYSTETGPLKAGRTYQLTEGAIDKPLSDAAFGLATGAVSQPIASQGAWYLIQPVGSSDVGQKPFDQVEASIKRMLKTNETNTLVKSWVANLVKSACGEIRYRAGYEPPNTVCGSA